MMDKKTEMLVWILDHQPDIVECTEIPVNDQDTRTQVTFRSTIDQCEYTVPDWNRLPNRSEFDDGMHMLFTPNYTGLFYVNDSRALSIVEKRDKNSELDEERLDLEARLLEINKELGLS